APENILTEVKSEQVESNRELIKDELCVNTFNDIIEAESKTCEAVHDMYNELMCAADGYEQVVLDEDKGQCEVVKYVQTPSDEFQHLPFHNLASILKNIIKNEKNNQNTTRILYDTFNKTNWIKFINGTKQYHYNLQDNTLKTIGYKYKNSNVEVKADQLIEVSNPGEFIDIYMQNQKDNYANIKLFMGAFLAQYLVEVMIKKGVNYIKTRKDADSLRITIVEDDGTSETITLGEYLNNVYSSLNNLTQAHNDLHDYVLKIKSCNCNQGGGGGMNQADINLALQMNNDMRQHMENHIRDLQNNQNRLFVDRAVGSTQDVFTQTILYRDAIPEIAKQVLERNEEKQKVDVQDKSSDRGKHHGDDYVWNELWKEWEEIIDEFDRPEGWREDRQASVPINYIWDLVHGEWVMIDNVHDNISPTWRHEMDSEYITYNLLKIYENDEDGFLRWSDRYQEWEWYSYYDYYTENESIYIPNRIRNNQEAFGPLFAWNIMDTQWQEHGHEFLDNWRTDSILNPPDNFIWDVEHEEWVIMTQHFDGVDGWRTIHTSEMIDIVEIRNSLLHLFGKIEWNEERKQWVWKPILENENNPPSPLALLSNDKSTGTSIALPDFVNNASSFEEVLKCYGVDICDDTPTLDETKPVLGKYIIKGDLEVNGKILCDSIPSGGTSGDSNFTIKNGYPEYEIKNDDIKPSSLEKTIRLDDTDITKKYNILTIDIPAELKTKLLTIKEHTNIFKITLRKNVVYDEQGNYIREFYIYVYQNKFVAPIVIKRENGCYLYNSSEISDTTSIAFDQELDFNPYDLYLRGELSINYEPSQDALVSTKPVVKCDIIEADNALKLQKSDIYYFYKPSKIIDEDAYYKMIYEIPTNYVIPNNMQFVFKEYCFGNEWKLTWNGTNWNGDNIKGRSNGKVIYKLKKNDNKDPFGSHGCYIMCKHDEWNQKFIDKNTENFMEYLWTKGKVEVSVKTKNGVVHPASDYSLHLNWHPADIKFEGYDLLGIDCVITEIDSSKIKVNEIDKIFADIYARAIPFTMTKYNDVATRLEFSPGSYHIDNTNHVSHVDLDAILDTIEKINYKVSSLKSFDKNIELYLYKQYTDPVDEVNWDSTTNPFDYIIKQQFYEIIPRPDAATTLYTDYNITSSKIITADNFTTMRSDLNLVTNNVDVMSYDV
ncbi:hypothetical protein M9Y10_030432, partial [Tritrichomonas musculus]